MNAVLWQTFWLAIALAAAKAVYLGLPEPTGAGLLRWATDALYIAQADLVVAAALGAGAAVAARRPRLERASRAALTGIGAICVLYAVASAWTFAYLRTPITYPLLSHAGDASDIPGYITGYMTLPVAAALVGAPLAFLLAGRATRSRRAAVAIGALVLLLGGSVYARQVAAPRWSGRGDRRIVESPHAALLGSLVAAAIGERAVILEDDFLPADLDDFATAGERGEARPPGRAALFLDPPPRNLVLVVLESTAARYLSLYGSPFDTTPALRAEAASAIVFEAFYSHVGASASALAAILLSRYPEVSWRELTQSRPRLEGTTLAELLRARGVRTSFIEGGDLTWASTDRFLEGRGFDEVLHAATLGAPRLTMWGIEDRHVFDAVIERLEPVRPFFILAWTAQAHHPYEPSPDREPVDFFRGLPTPPRDAWDLGRYLNVLRETDRQIARLFAALRERGLADDTLVAITGDHGQSFGFPHEAWGHGFSVYDEAVRVPLVLWNPRFAPRAGRSGAVGGHVDLNATLAHLLGIAPAPPWQGRSLLGADRPPRAYFFAAKDGYRLGVRDGRWKYILDTSRGHEQLFDLAADPDEWRDLARERPEIARRLRQRLGAWMADQRRRYPPE